MQQSNVRPNRATFAVILSSCSGKRLLHLGQQVHAASTRMTLHLDLFLASGLVDLYSKCGRLDTARRVFDRMMERDIVSWNSMISVSPSPLGVERPSSSSSR
ncbi:unnamed protein product [Spirodela intermedia]|uniref:Pentatricopeptide repeat-containing protein n=1 Tax=Spirodela intermedia TaxID=51605 RepID=A0ABN7EC50_SPIIN|nr:unnamed protein product [Spirodela intermedia]